jgi:hypothetical protein
MMIFQVLAFTFKFCSELGFARKRINNLTNYFIDILIKNLNHLYSFGCLKKPALNVPISPNPKPSQRRAE